MLFFRRQGDTSNTVIGIILLVMLLVFIGPSVLPTVLSRTLPGIDESIPCNRLLTSQNRAVHQSLIGRSSQDPLSIRVTASPLPTQAGEQLTIRIVLVNNTIGTIPIVFDENQIVVGDQPDTSGVGLLFEPPNNLSTGNARQNAGTTTFPQQNIRLLGPRQRCVLRVNFPFEQVSAANLSSVQTNVRGYYRITTAGTTQAPPGTNAIFNDQGLDIVQGGIIISEPALIPIRVPAN